MFELFQAAAGYDLRALASIEARLDAAIAVVAQRHGLSSENAQRFAELVRRSYPAPSTQGIAAGHAGSATLLDPRPLTGAALGKILPLFVELVLTFADRRFAGQALLTQGRVQDSLDVALTESLQAVLTIWLESGGDPATAELMARCFCTAFPRLDDLAAFSPLAQAFVAGFVPTGGVPKVKLYFNTRLAGPHAHTERVLELVHHAGAAHEGRARELLDALYGPDAATRFYGVGVDFAAGAKPRAKLYVRVNRSALAAFFERHAALLFAALDAAAIRALREQIDAHLRSLESPALLEDTELAVAITPEDTSAKLTCFFAPPRVTVEDEARVVGLLERAGYDPSALVAATTQLAATSGPTRAYQRPLHAIGLELWGDARPLKVNVYLQPTL